MPYARTKKSFGVLATVAVAATLVVAPLASAGAAAAELVGTVGTLVAWTSDSNKASYWEDLFAEHDPVCVKSDADTDRGIVTDEGKTVTLDPYAPGSEDRWELLVVKGGSLWNNVVEYPQRGVAYASPENSGGKQSDVSHWIFCEGSTPSSTEPPAKPQDTVTSEEAFEYDCTRLEVTITTVTTTTSSEWSGYEWVSTAPTDETTTRTRAMTVEEKLGCPLPDAVVVYRAWVDGEWGCGDTEVAQSREVITTEYGRDAAGNPTAVSSLVTETKTRPLTQDEIGQCPLVPGVIAATCQGDVPYLTYSLSLPEGFVAGPNPVTITFVNPAGDDYAVSGNPLTGALLWPGAQATEPRMWPGWDLVNGTYVPTDANYAWTRDGVTVRFEVNPTYSTFVEYPVATAVCADPPEQALSPETPAEGEEPGEPAGSGSDDPAPAGVASDAPDTALASTGGAFGLIIPISGGAALVVALGALLVATRRRRNAPS